MRAPDPDSRQRFTADFRGHGGRSVFEGGLACADAVALPPLNGSDAVVSIAGTVNSLDSVDGVTGSGGAFTLDLRVLPVVP